jgi:hypothetical protein
MRKTRVAVGAVAALLAVAMALATASPVPGLAGRPEGLVVHEWGTFSSFSGSDGALLPFHPANTDLPKFVYRGSWPFKDGYEGTVSLETPVLYFYTGKPLTVAVESRFPEGVFTEWFPQAERLPADPRTLRWADVRVRPDGPVTLPTAPGANHYYAARETDAAPLEVAYRKDGKERRDQEGFLFYRGVGKPTPPLTVTAAGRGAFSVRVSGKEAVPALLLVEVKGGAVRFRQIGPLAAGQSATLTLPDALSEPSPLRSALVATLVKAGLYEKEARAMVKTWESAWFGDEGVRVLYVLPSGWTDRTLPLRVTPKPDGLVRVMVGRHDLLTPERERDVERLVKESKGPSAAARASAARELAKLGRFAAPAQKKAEERLAGRR